MMDFMGTNVDYFNNDAILLLGVAVECSSSWMTCTVCMVRLPVWLGGKLARNGNGNERVAPSEVKCARARPRTECRRGQRSRQTSYNETLYAAIDYSIFFSFKSNHCNSSSFYLFNSLC